METFLEKWGEFIQSAHIESFEKYRKENILEPLAVAEQKYKDFVLEIYSVIVHN